MHRHHTRPGLAVAIASLIIAIGQSDAFAYQLNSLGQAGGWDDINKQPVITTVIDRSDYTGDLSAGLIDSALSAGYAT